jgi:hypothetical protein
MFPGASAHASASAALARFGCNYALLRSFVPRNFSRNLASFHECASRSLVSRSSGLATGAR